MHFYLCSSIDFYVRDLNDPTDISSTRRRMAIHYRLPRPIATFTSAIFRAKMVLVMFYLFFDACDHSQRKKIATHPI